MSQDIEKTWLWHVTEGGWFPYHNTVNVGKKLDAESTVLHIWLVKSLRKSLTNLWHWLVAWIDKFWECFKSKWQTN